MKNLIIIFLAGVSLSVQGQVWEWVKTIDKGAFENARNIGVDEKGNIYVIGISRYASGNSETWHNEWFLKLNSDGSLLWEKQIDAFFSKSVTDSDGNTYIISGKKLKKFNPYGNLIFEQADDDVLYFNSICLNPKEEGVIICGKMHSADTLVSKITSTSAEGNINWTRNGDLSAGGSDPFDLNMDFKGNLFLLDKNHPKITSIWQFNENGNFVRKKEIIATYPSNPVIDKNGNFYLFGGYHHTNPLLVNGVTYTSDDLYGGRYIIKLDSMGEPLWVKDLGEQKISVGAMATDNEANLYIAGTFEYTFKIDDIELKSERKDIVVMKLDKDGKLTWVKNSKIESIGGPLIEAMAIDNKGDLLLSGRISGAYTFDEHQVDVQDMYGDMFVAKISQSKITSIETKETGHYFNLFPNPSNGTFIIQHNYSGVKSISVRNLSGTVVYNSSKFKVQGLKLDDHAQRESINLDLSPGIYFVELQTENERLVKKVVVGR
jgi:hypothetical protein